MKTTYSICQKRILSSPPTSSIIGDINTGRCYRKTLEALVKNPDVDMILPKVVAMDKTQVDTYGRLQMEPLTIVSQAGQSVQCERKVIRGKYTVQNSGTCKYGGWSHDGMKRFNYLYALVKEDRKSPQAPAMEKEFLDYCIREGNDTKAGGRRNDEPTAIEGSASMLLQPHYIRAAWDLKAE